MSITTSRLMLRAWQPSDLEAFAAMNADPVVMKYFPRTLSREESDQMVRRIEQHYEDRGFCFWAVEIKGITPFAGFIGLNVPTYKTDFAPFVEVGWRLAAAYWRQGYATEGARASLRYGFEELGLDEIVSYTVPDNLPSRGVMEKVGMVRSADEDFEHPSLPTGHRLRQHVLYRMSAQRWRSVEESNR